MGNTTRTLLTLASTAALLCLVGLLFWYQDWQYSLPTPRPVGLRQLSVGARARLPPALERVQRTAAGKPLFLHAFNPACPCSRFNIEHVRQLVQQYGDRAVFVALLQGEEAATLQKAFAAQHLDLPALIDRDGAIAASLGVYSTPQAVLLSSDGRLYYRGNYNASRYCTDHATEFARIALDTLLIAQPPPALDPSATVAYGCPLPRRRNAELRP